MIQSRISLTYYNPYIIRFGFKIVVPNGVKQKSVGAKAQSWPNMDCMELWLDTLFLYLIVSSRPLEKDMMVRVLHGY